MEKEDLFAHKSKTWDQKERRVKTAEAIARIISSRINLNENMTILDFGAGTGLLSGFIAPQVGKIIAVDNSPAMLGEFNKKNFPCETELLKLNPDKEKFRNDLKCDGIISSMTLHHIKDLKNLFKEFYKILKTGGFIALADLEKEDGSFHSDNKGVYHFGFEKEHLEKTLKECGFKEISFHHAYTIKKPHKDFNVFCLIAKK